VKLVGREYVLVELVGLEYAGVGREYVGVELVGRGGVGVELGSRILHGRF
jgi:hypothetical protein